MKVICYDRVKEGVTMDMIKPYLPEETAHAWRLWKKGVIRENYALADRPGVVIIFEAKNSAEALAYLADFPLSKAGYIEWFAIPVIAPLPLEAMFNESALARVAIPDSEEEWAQEVDPS